MRFGLVHRIMTDALAVLGVLAVVSSAALGVWTNAAVLVGLALALAVPEAWQSRPLFRHAATTGMVLLLLAQSARIVAGQAVIDVIVEFAMLLQVVRVATRRGAAHDQQIIVLALLHFVAGTVLGGGLTYGLCFLGFLVVAPGALVLSHLRREVEGNYRQGARDRTGLPVDVPRILRSRRVVGRGFLLSTCLISVPIFLFTALLFVLFPRVGLSLLLLNHPHAGRMVGFSDHVDLGEVGVLRSDPSIALRFELATADPPPPRITLRLRGTAFDSYDGRAWARTQGDRHAADRYVGGATYPLVRGPKSGDTKISFDVEPIDPPVVFLPPHAVAIQLKMAPPALMADPWVLQRGPEGELRYGGGDARGVRYDVYVAPDTEVLTEVLSDQDRARYIAVPASLPTRLAALAHTWTDDQPTPLAKAKAIEDHLRHDYRYDLASPSSGTPQPVDHFLFESKRGHCEFFSTAMAMLLREIGIPSRNVTGFVGGTYNRFGHYYAVREGDAHSWIEAYVDDPTSPGWITFDPTPASGAQPLGDTTGTWVYLRDLVEALSQRWNTYVVGYDLRTQVRLVEGIGTRYDGLRKNVGLDKGALGKLTRGPVVATAALLLALLAYVVWKRRGRTTGAKPREAKSTQERALLAATALYRSLETALAVKGLRRPAGLPPLRFAEQLQARAHPLAGTVLKLTSLYLEARFGGADVDGEMREEYEEGVKRVRRWERAA